MSPEYKEMGWKKEEMRNGEEEKKGNVLPAVGIPEYVDGIKLSTSVIYIKQPVL